MGWMSAAVLGRCRHLDDALDRRPPRVDVRSDGASRAVVAQVAHAVQSECRRRAAHRTYRATAPWPADQRRAAKGDDDCRLLAVRRFHLLVLRARAERDPKRTPAGAAPDAVSRRSESPVAAVVHGKRGLVRMAK